MEGEGLGAIAGALRALADRIEEASRAAPGAPGDPVRALERLIVADAICSVVRHDLRNHLGSIQNAAFYLKRRMQGTDVWQSDPRVSQFFDLIGEMVTASMALVDDRIRPQLGIGAGVARVTGRACLERAVQWLGVPDAMSIEMADGLAAEEVEAPLAEVAFALRCLLDNAIEAAGEAGRVTVAIGVEGGSLVVEVRDDGDGIPEGDRARIFDPFYTTRPGHAGLGLNLAWRVARRYGGDVTVRPSARGACVAFALPLADGPPAQRSG